MKVLGVRYYATWSGKYRRVTFFENEMKIRQYRTEENAVPTKAQTENYYWQLLHLHNPAPITETVGVTLVRPPQSFIHLWLSIQSSDGCYPIQTQKSTFYQLV